VANPVYGDMLYELRYTEYKDFAGREIPDCPAHSSGDPLRTIAHKFMEIKVTSVQSNVTVPAIRVPVAVRIATAAADEFSRKSWPASGLASPPLARLGWKFRF
jgi:hypothetical protein